MELDVRTLHGKRVAFRRAGSGPPLFLIHGITNSGQSWEPAMRLLARDFDVIAPDLPGHGNSDRQRGDHSLGIHACVMRDLLHVLEIDRVTVVGHSLGGGVAMQFSYQFPEMVERLVLVGSGGLGREVSPLVRSAALPFAEQVLPLLTARPLVDSVTAIAGLLGKVGLKPGADLAEISRGIASLGDTERRAAFVRTVRSVMSPRGQRVTANDRLYLAAETPMLIVWGERDPIIPVEHGLAAHAQLPNSRLEVFENAGHFPQLDDPLRFAELLTDFVADTEPAVHDADTVRARLVEHAAAASA
ncbi:MAG TPA: alpha/beta hydrolase [Thermoleophilaceae bacterium]|nr:alpha/beta hydrolase [Thermoleophilaceae bacterium]